MVSFRIVAGVLIAAACLASCTASSDEVRPPSDRFFFPTGLALHPDESRLFVASANSDLRYDSGAVSVINLDEVDAMIAAWNSTKVEPAGCHRDAEFGETLVCGEAMFLGGRGVRVGNFPAAIAAQDTGGGNLRLILPVRGDPSVTWIDWQAAEERLLCEDSGKGFPQCDDAHRLTQLRNDESLPGLAAEPFGVAVDSAGQYAVVTHLSLGTVTLVDSPRDGTPILSDALAGMFQQRNTASGVVDIAGSTAVAVRPSTRADVAGGPVYAAGRTQNLVQVLSVERTNRPLMLPTTRFSLASTGTGDLADSRAMAFDKTGDRMYIVNRSPPVLHFYDTSLTKGGYPANRSLGGTDICEEASSVAVADMGEGDRAFVTCFSDGEMWIVDPRAGGSIEAFVQVGRGPYGVALSPKRHRAYVSNFLEDTVAVVDLSPDASTRNRVVLRIGDPLQ